jgi:hypothetical protein
LSECSWKLCQTIYILFVDFPKRSLAVLMEVFISVKDHFWLSYSQINGSQLHRRVMLWVEKDRATVDMYRAPRRKKKRPLKKRLSECLWKLCQTIYILFVDFPKRSLAVLMEVFISVKDHFGLSYSQITRS